jgi:hypothetical protein
MPAHAAKPRVRSFSSSPIVAGLVARRIHWVPVLGVFPLVAAGNVPWWLVVAVSVPALVIELWMLLGFPGHGAFVGVLRQLHAELPWFDAGSTTWLRPEQEAELRDALARHVFVVRELDGRTIRGVRDLAEALEAVFGKRTFPRDPVAKSIAILTKAGADTRRHTAVLWRDSGELLRHDPAGATRFLQGWSDAMAATTPHLLLFLFEPATVPPAAPSTPPAEPAEAVSSRPTAAANAWWQRRPGELT